MNKKIVKILSIIFVVIFALPFGVVARSISDIEKEQAQLAAEKKELEEKLAELKGDEAEAKAYQDTLIANIEIAKKRIDTANITINELNLSISDLEKKLEQSAKDYEATMELLKERVVAIYKAGETSTLEILLNSTSLSDFSMRTTALDAVAEHDKKLMDDINTYIDETKIDRENLKRQKEQLAQLKVQLEKDQKDLEILMEENKEVLEELAILAGETAGQINAIEKEDAALDKQIADIIEQQKQEEENNNAGTQLPSGPGIAGFDASWPVPGYGTNWITQYWSASHKGLDIAAPYGTPIVATEDGEVVSVFYHSSWGKNVLIYHNGTYSTRYAHMSSYAVSPGDKVKKNQVIGYIGNTGYSFGNHLHFEIYKNGVRVNPYPYL